MPTVYQPTTFKPIPAAASRSTDPATGRRVAAWTARGGRKVRAEITPDGNRCKVKSPTWWVEYTDDKGKRVRVPGYRDRAATLDLAARLQRKARAVRGGYDTPGEDSDRSGPRPLADYLPDFRTDLELAGSGRQHVLNVVMHVTETVRALRLTTAASVDCRKVARWLRAEQLRLGWAAETHNRWVQHLRQFGLWLVSIDRAARNPFAGLARVPVAARSRTRRRIDHEHLGVLLATVRDLRGVNHGLTGPERASLYLVASYTGFRRGALASLTPESVAWDDTPGRSGGLPVSVTVAAKAAKNKKPHTVPLHPDVAAELAPWLRTRPAGQPLWPGRVVRRGPQDAAVVGVEGGGHAAGRPRRGPRGMGGGGGDPGGAAAAGGVGRAALLRRGRRGVRLPLAPGAVHLGAGAGGRAADGRSAAGRPLDAAAHGERVHEVGQRVGRRGGEAPRAGDFGWGTSWGSFNVSVAEVSETGRTRPRPTTHGRTWETWENRLKPAAGRAEGGGVEPPRACASPVFETDERARRTPRNPRRWRGAGGSFGARVGVPVLLRGRFPSWLPFLFAVALRAVPRNKPVAAESLPVERPGPEKLADAAVHAPDDFRGF
jgi:site-specific recombinase XerC